jgi:hypothetical protein
MSKSMRRWRLMCRAVTCAGILSLPIGCAQAPHRAECHGLWVPVNPTTEAGHG